MGPVPWRSDFAVGPEDPSGSKVLDQGQGFEPQIPPGPVHAHETAGRGLHVVEQLSDRWGISPDGGTWAELTAKA